MSFDEDISVFMSSIVPYDEYSSNSSTADFNFSLTSFCNPGNEAGLLF